MKERNLQVYWPEANSLIRRDVVEPECGIPDFTAIVEVLPAKAAVERPAVERPAGGATGGWSGWRGSGLT